MAGEVHGERGEGDSSVPLGVTGWPSEGLVASPLLGPDVLPELTFLHPDVVKHRRKGEVID